MANRIVMGERSGQYGLWVSKPGFNVLTTGQENMLLSMGEDSLQSVHTGTVTISSSGAEVAVSMPISLPFTPLILMQLSPRTNVWKNEVGDEFLEVHTPRYRRLSATSIGFSVRIGSGLDEVPTFTLTYTVLLKELYC